MAIGSWLAIGVLLVLLAVAAELWNPLPAPWSRVVRIAALVFAILLILRLAGFA